MEIMTLLELLANNAHHRIAIHELIHRQPSQIQEAFFAKNSAYLRNQLGDTQNLADRCGVVALNHA